MTLPLNVTFGTANRMPPTSVTRKVSEKSDLSLTSKIQFDRFLLQCFLTMGEFPVVKIDILSSRMVCVPDPQNLQPTASNFLSLTHAVACNKPLKKEIIPSLVAENIAKRMNPTEKAHCLTTLAIINGDLGLNMRSFSYPFFYVNSFEYPHHSSVQEILEEAKRISKLLLTRPELRKFVPYLKTLPPPTHPLILKEWLESIEKRLLQLLNGNTVLFSKYQFFYQKTSGTTLASWDCIPLGNRPYALKFSNAFDAISSIEVPLRFSLPKFLINTPCVILNLETRDEIPLFTWEGLVPHSPVCSVIYNPKNPLENELVNLTQLPTVVGQTAPVAELEHLFLIGRVHPLVSLNSGFATPPHQEKQIMDFEMFSKLLPQKQIQIDSISDLPDFRVSDQPQSHLVFPESQNWGGKFNKTSTTSLDSPLSNYD